MIGTAISPEILFGQSLYAAATLMRFARLYAGLGKARPPFASGLLAAHCLGVAAGYFWGVLWYECAIVLFFALCKRDALVAAFVVLLLVRGLDAALLLLLSFHVASYADMRLMLLCLGTLLLGIGFVFISLGALLRRIEKKILECPHPLAGLLPMLRSLHAVRGQIRLLSWHRAGSISILILLTLGGWLVEWLAFFRLCPTAEQALMGMLGRVMGSFHFMAANAGNGVLDVLQPGVWGLLAISVATALTRLLRIRIFRRPA